VPGAARRDVVGLSLNEEHPQLPMSMITIIWSMSASACLTLAGIHFLVWSRNRTALANLFFSLLAMGTAAWTICELWMMRADTPVEFATVLRWGHVAVWLIVVCLVGFVHFYLKSGRPWLAWTVCGLRTLLLVVNFLVGQNLNYREVTRLEHIRLLGESVTIADGVPNPWILLGQLNLVTLIIFLIDATVTGWRRGNRHRALTVGGSMVFYILVSTGQSLLTFYGIIRLPYVGTVFFMGLIAVMGFELSGETVRALQLDRKLRDSEAGLHEIEERMRLAVEAVDFGIWIRDLARNEIWATDKCRALFGFAETERLELDRILERIYPDDREAVRLVLEKATEGDGSYESEYRIVLPSGEVRWIGSRSRVEFDGARKPILVRGISRDITRRKLTDLETQELRKEIALVDRVSMMGQLASALAHEINQPLGAILRNAEAAELFMQNASPDFEEIRAIFADIRKDDERAGNVIDRMRGLLKRQSLDRRPVDVGELVGEVAALLRSDAAARHVKLELAVADHLPRLIGDAVHLQQVLLNLIVNGMDALDGATVKERRVCVTASLDGPDAVEIAVSDSGQGIPADTFTHIFDPFFTTKPKGMGMGLPICRTIIEAHKGRLWAENQVGGGASFRFTLPITEEGARK
jgi:two-component system, LuxR family, sensor kinase FixL